MTSTSCARITVKHHSWRLGSIYHAPKQWISITSAFRPKKLSTCIWMRTTWVSNTPHLQQHYHGLKSITIVIGHTICQKRIVMSILVYKTPHRAAYMARLVNATKSLLGLLPSLEHFCVLLYMAHPLLWPIHSVVGHIVVQNLLAVMSEYVVVPLEQVIEPIAVCPWSKKDLAIISCPISWILL